MPIDDVHAGQHLASGQTDQLMPARPGLSVVIPAYNESHRLGECLRAIRQYVEGAGITCELIVVDDGSTDGSGEVVGAFDASSLCLRLLRNERNRGKGYSVRRGMLVANGSLILMTDADLSVPIDQLDKLLPLIEAGDDVVIGSRDMPDSILRPAQPRSRRVAGRMFRALRRAFLLPGLCDTQCGFKLFRREDARAIFERQRANGFAFDVEVLAIAERDGLRIREVGVLWRNDPDSRVRWRNTFGVVISLMRIWWRVSRQVRGD